MMTKEQWLRYGTIGERDACGIGAVVDIHGKQTHQTVDDALKIVERLEHRTGKDALGQTGDGVGIRDGDIVVIRRQMRQAHRDWIWARPETTPWACSFSPRIP